MHERNTHISESPLKQHKRHAQTRSAEMLLALMVFSAGVGYLAYRGLQHVVMGTFATAAGAQGFFTQSLLLFILCAFAVSATAVFLSSATGLFKIVSVRINEGQPSSQVNDRYEEYRDV